MALVAINTRKQQKEPEAFFHNGLRPFFLAATIFSILAMSMWTAAYSFHHVPMDSPISILQWHSHEMVYGFCLAVISGFLLAALPEWTNVKTVHGYKLMGLLILWAIPRVLFLFGTKLLLLCAFVDIMFCACLFIAAAHPIIASKNWRQLGILSKLLLFTIGNALFYLGAFELFPHGAALGVYGGLYLVVSLILTIGGRVLPGFIQNGVDYDVTLSNPRWLGRASMILFLIFFISELIVPGARLAGYLAISLFGVTTARLYCWHTAGIWRKPLLWGTYSAIVAIALGFLLFAAGSLGTINKFLAIHAFTVGGIGLATVSMMARAALGHYGENVRNPPRLVSYALGAMILSFAARVLLPLVDGAHYGAYILAAQGAWISSYALLFVVLMRVCISHSYLARPVRGKGLAR